jgi:hypothetical protein
MKAPHFQALPLARSVLSRELRRKGPVRWESQRGLTTSETCRVSNPACSSACANDLIYSLQGLELLVTVLSRAEPAAAA